MPILQVPRRLSILPGLSLLLLLAACSSGGGGGTVTGDHAGTPDPKLALTPPSATLAVGQTLQFTAATPWGKDVTWSVLPASGGTITAGGRFTASGAPGRYTIVAIWKNDARYTATAATTIVAAPPPAELNPDLVQTPGAAQGSTDGKLANHAILGEATPPVVSKDASGVTEVRHGFAPPVPSK